MHVHVVKKQNSLEIWVFMCLQGCGYGIIFGRHCRTRKSSILHTQAVLLKGSKLFGFVVMMNPRRLALNLFPDIKNLVTIRLVVS